MNEKWPYRTPGIPDELFSRGGVPMTKEEIRVLTLARARLAPGQVVWDIGAGTGSLTVEAAFQVSPGGVVYAVERNPDGIKLINDNLKAFLLDNVKVIQGQAPEALARLPAPHRVLVGGSGGKLEEILALVKERLLPGGRLVLNAVTLETAAGAVRLFDIMFDKVGAVQVSAARLAPAGTSHLFKSLNPVMIISAEKGE